MRIVNAFLSLLQSATEHLVMAFVVIMALLMFAAVITRYVSGGTVLYTEIFLTGLMAWIVILLLGPVARRDDHIRINVVADLLFRRRARTVWAAVENFVLLPLCIYFTWVGVYWVAYLKEKGLQQFAGDLLYGQWIPSLVVPLGMGIASIFYIERTVRQVRSFFTHRGDKAGRATGGGEEAEGVEGIDTEVIQ